MTPPPSQGYGPVRRARREDAAELARLVAPQGFDRSGEDVLAVWDAWETEGNFALVIDCEGDEGAEDGLLGAVTLHRMHVLHRACPVGRVTSLAVDPRAQGRGLGRALMAAAEAALAELGCGVVEVTSHRRRERAHAFYRHLGYERTSHRFARELDAREP